MRQLIAAALLFSLAACGAEPRERPSYDATLPLAQPDADGVEWLLRHGSEARALEQRMKAAEIIGTFRALIFDGTTERAVERLRELRRLVREP